MASTITAHTNILVNSLNTKVISLLSISILINFPLGETRDELDHKEFLRLTVSSL